jgi:hypothetical protein
MMIRANDARFQKHRTGDYGSIVSGPMMTEKEHLSCTCLAVNCCVRSVPPETAMMGLRGHDNPRNTRLPMLSPLLDVSLPHRHTNGQKTPYMG